MKNKIKKIIILFTILLILSISILVMYIFSNKGKATIKLKDINNSEIKSEEIVEFDLPENIDILISKYNGNIENRVIYKNLYYFANTLVPKYYKDLKGLTEEQIKKYYTKNKEVIYIELGIDNEEKFYSFVNNFNKLREKELKYSNFSILESSIKRIGNGKVGAYLLITFENGENIIFNFVIEDEANKERTSILYDTVINEEVVNQDENKENQKIYEPDELDFVRGKAIQ